MHPITKTAKADYDDIVLSTQRARGDQAEHCLQNMTNNLLHETAQGSIDFDTLPAYAGLAFRGKIRFNNRRAVLALQKHEPQEIPAKLKGTAAASIHPDAKNAWVYLSTNNPAAAGLALVLNAFGDPQKQKYVDPNQVDDAESDDEYTDAEFEDEDAVA